MSFETIKFIDWMKTKGEAKINLSRSGSESISIKDLDVDSKHDVFEAMKVAINNRTNVKPRD